MIEFKNISKSFDGVNIIDNFNLKIADGERIAIMGKSGVGKSTLLNILLDLVAQDKGDIIGLPKNKGVVFQQDRLLDEFSAFDNISLVCNEDRQTIIEHFKELGLSGEEDKLARDYSGGMRRRLAIMRAVLAKSDLIIMDEAFKGLDSDSKTKSIDYVNKYTQNKTCVFVTHDINDAKRLNCSRIIDI